MNLAVRTLNNIPQITVIVAVKNAADSLNDCLLSITSQRYSSKELIVIDGGSSDGSMEIIKKFDNCITYWESKSDRGIYHAWNKALKHAKGDWICFLGADDYFHDEDVLTNLVPHLLWAETQGIKAVYGRVTKVDHNGNIVRIEGQPWSKVGWLMRHGMPIPHPGLMHHKSLFETHGYFDESFRIAGDYDLLLRELKNNPALFAGDVNTVICRTGGVADSNNLQTCREVATARRKSELPVFSWVWTIVYIRALLRKILHKFK